MDHDFDDAVSFDPDFFDRGLFDIGLIDPGLFGSGSLDPGSLDPGSLAPGLLNSDAYAYLPQEGDFGGTEAFVWSNPEQQETATENSQTSPLVQVSTYGYFPTNNALYENDALNGSALRSQPINVPTAEQGIREMGFLPSTQNKDTEELLTSSAPLSSANRDLAVSHDEEILTKHTTSKGQKKPKGSFKCTFPGCSRKKEFNRNYELQRHMKKHEAKVQYDCPVISCNRNGPRAFYRGDKMLAHKKRELFEYREQILRLDPPFAWNVIFDDLLAVQGH
ncbi:hypothetical protein K490DRAFT_65314 [Saccharata proteae CBS 121410]|uniref:C2H2-type domain-containing protein n=1 Tax=Saccharata proteae CBS 121410 TaxID=1314787 RepID=A0A9P4LXT1_9PEZI|nr:hypothetical protein K490DRAFT_65314 [Saccharata proteae CBS 121410]